jgi:hypothetical protein
MAAQFRISRAATMFIVAFISGFAGYGLRVLTETTPVESTNEDSTTIAVNTKSSAECELTSELLDHRSFTYEEVVRCLVDDKPLRLEFYGGATDVAGSNESLIVKSYTVGDLITLHATTDVLTSQSFDQLIDLIIATVEHDSWMENGAGWGEIQPFPSNKSLVVSQTERVHQQIADLLEQLRQLHNSSAEL